MNLQLLHSENGFYTTLTAQADADSNQQPESSKVRHATHSATRLGNFRRNTKFKDHHSTSQHVAARHAARINVSSHVMQRKNFNH
jgi:hypothetical protein